MIADFLVGFYRFWHGSLKLQGAGRLLRTLARLLPGMQAFPLALSPGHSVVLDFRDDSAFYWLNYTLGESYEERGLLLGVARFLKPGMVMWDVGANCGLFSYMLAQGRGLKELDFFEPNPRMFQIAAAALGPLGCARGYSVALSDSGRSSSFTIPVGGSTTGTLEADRTGREGEVITIECATADDLVASGDLAAPDVVKIDTEGHELAVLKGMEHIIARYRPVIFFEHISLSDAEMATCVPPGYALYSVDDDDGTLKIGMSRSRGHNSALLPADMKPAPTQNPPPAG